MALLARLAYRCYHDRRRVVFAWIALFIGVTGLNSVAGGKFLDEFSLPGTDSQSALDRLKAHGFTERTGFSGQIVFRADNGFDDPDVEAAMTKLFEDFKRSIPNIAVSSPYEPDARQLRSERNQHIAYAEVNLADRPTDEYRDAGDIGRRLAKQVNLPGLEVELGGDVFVDNVEFGSEGVGFLAAMVILLFAFGSVLAMGLPLLTAMFGIGTGVALVGLAVNFISMPSFSVQSVMMIAIGVGIDYALFIVTRYREALHDGASPEAAVIRAIDTAGRAVLFAGTTVIIAVLGLITIGLTMFRGLAIGISIGVLTTMGTALTLLPAVLGFVGTNIDKLAVGRKRGPATGARASAWLRWSRLIQRRPWPALVVGCVTLIALASPLAGLRLGLGDAGNRPDHDTTRRAYDLLSIGFGPGFNGPFLLVAQVPGPNDVAALGSLPAVLNTTPGVAFATPPVFNGQSTAAIITVFPTTAPQDKETHDLVRRLRHVVVPTALAGSTASVKIGGMTAIGLDFTDYTAERLPIFIVTVLVLSFLLLMTVFRSVLVPLKAVIMNLLSIGASYGLMVMVFQWGWGADLIGVGKQGPIDAWAPLLLFAVLFGLSMDYEVFLLSRIKEEYDRTGDNASAVATGLAATARVITAAAGIMVVVFASFMLGEDRGIKLMGLGLASAVFLDATIVRMVLVPATMELLGDRNWWLPPWLDRRLPVIHVEPQPYEYEESVFADEPDEEPDAADEPDFVEVPAFAPNPAYGGQPADAEQPVYAEQLAQAGQPAFSGEHGYAGPSTYAESPGALAEPPAPYAPPVPAPPPAPPGPDDAVILLPPDPDRVIADAEDLATRVVVAARHQVGLALTGTPGESVDWYSDWVTEVRRLQDQLTGPSAAEWPAGPAVRAEVEQILSEARAEAVGIVVNGRRHLRDELARRAGRNAPASRESATSASTSVSLD